MKQKRDLYGPLCAAAGMQFIPFVVDSFGWIEEDAHGWFRKNIVAKFRGPAHVAYYGPLSVPSEATAWASLSAIIHCAVAAHTFRSKECAAPPADAT